MHRLAAILVLLVASAPAAAERLATSISHRQVLVNSSFTGTELVIFGTIEQDKDSAPRKSRYDIVVTVTGPTETLVTRRKDRVAGIWVNVDSRTFVEVPSYLDILTTRPIEDIANKEALRRLQVGLDFFLLRQQIGADLADVVPSDPFRMNFLRIQEERALYRQLAGGVTFLSPTLFRATIQVPAEAPLGSYNIDVKLFADGGMIARDASSFDVRKVGFEQFVANSAREDGLLYGLATAAMAICTGWIASIVFRRD